MLHCPSENELVDFAEGRLSAEAQRSLHDHIDSCSDCRTVLSDLACAEVNPRDPTAVLRPASTPQAKAVAVVGAPTSQRFQILRKLGQGGMGVVYEAIDRERNRRVALKTLRSMSPDALLRFKNEFRALQDLEHENLVRFHDLVEENGHWWFTMELLFGVDFLTYVQSEPQPGAAVCLDEARLRAALLQLAEGLHFLHGSGKVHRDIKPHNILVTSSGRVVILDFGLVGDRAQQDSAVVGTIAYMAPEQAAAEQTGSAADWYSVGVMLFEALTGTLPTSGNTMEVFAAKLRGQILPLGALNAEAPEDLAALCGTLLASNPTSRPKGEEILRGLRHATHSPSSNRDTSSALSSASSLFVGRQAESHALKEIFEKTRAGREALVLIEGESGVGKSALMRHFTASLPTQFPDIVVLTGRCYEREAVPYKAFDGIIDALSRYMKRLSKDKAAALLPRRAATLLQAFPVLGLVPAMAEAPVVAEVLDPKEQRSRVFAALRELFARLCERHPLALWIDDLQWADADSLALLMHLMSPPEAPPLLLLSTLRPLTEARPDGLRDEVLRQLRHVDRIRLGPLQEDEATNLAEQLMQERTDPQSFDVKAIVQEAGGHPLFLDELVRRAREAPGRTGVLRLDDAIWARVSALPLRRSGFCG